MPLVRIDIVKGVRSPEQVKKLADVVQRVLLDHFNAPLAIVTNNCQIITQHEDYELICEDTDLGLTRSRELVVIQIFQQGRTEEQKKATYKYSFENLSRYCGVSGDDLIITCLENTQADWSFGTGEAQFLTGRL
ncbi:Tautomerase/MIF superfamily [Fusarium oxysporum f. sp. vasinfectum]|nr:Tautomerase/MIF superfamily [Fusarium oxysporum f. sp. vasinfectum]KAK2935110.1 Tautomerase/MIF superfamily [Fusarium oxysporum f. sp. vasinfectum]